MKLKSAFLLIAAFVTMSTTIITAPVFSGPPYYHEEGNVNYPGSQNESWYIASGVGVDDYITMVDLAIWELYWHPHLYHPDVDFNGDGQVDTRDFSTVCLHMGLNYHYSPFVAEPGTPKVKVVTIPLGDSVFAVVIEIQDVVNLRSYEFTLNWNLDSLSVIDVWHGGFMGEIQFEGGYWFTIGTNYLYYGYSAASHPPYPETQSGSGTLAGIMFERIDPEGTPLDFSSRLLNFSICSMPHQDEDGAIPSMPPKERTQALIETIETWNLPPGTENALTPKLQAVIDLLAMGNENGAVHKLGDFISQVEAFRGKKLTNEQADYLIAEARRIIDLIQE